MPWLEQTSGGLPDPEPWGKEAGQLQQDILDELSDHLDCALSRELRKTTDGDEASARARVLKKFGNPRKLARSLWFAAMKEQVMSNRIMMTTNIVLAFAVLAICIFTISAMKRNNAITEAILAKLEEITDTSTSGIPPDWGHITVMVSSGNPQLRPVSGFRFSLHGYPFDSQNQQFISGEADEYGTYTFGPIRAGSYRLDTYSAQGEGNTSHVTLYPGGHPEAEVHYQRPAPKPEPFSFAWNIPTELESAFAYAMLEFRITKFANPDNPDETWHLDHTFHVLVRADGQAALLAEARDIITHLDEDRVSIDSGKLQFQEQLELDNSIGYFIAMSKLYLNRKDPDPNLNRTRSDVAGHGKEYGFLDFKRMAQSQGQTGTLFGKMFRILSKPGNPNEIILTLPESRNAREKAPLPAHNVDD